MPAPHHDHSLYSLTPSRVAASHSPPLHPRCRRLLHSRGRGNFTSFFWDAHAELCREMMSPDTSFSSNGSFCDYSYSDDGEVDEPRYGNVPTTKTKDSGSLATGGDSGVASACSIFSDASTQYSKIRSERGLGQRSQSSSTIDHHTWDRREQRKRGGGGATAAAAAREEQQQKRRAPQRNTYASASFHHSRVSAPPGADGGRYNVSKRKIYENLDMTVAHRPSSMSSSSSTSAKPSQPCCWECFEALVERDRMSAGLPTRTAYLPEPVENHYENISFDDARSAPSSRSVAGATPRHSGADRSGPAVPPKSARVAHRSSGTVASSEENVGSNTSDLYARLCSIAFSELRAARFADERLASLQRKIEKLLGVKSNMDLSEKNLSDSEFAKATNQVVYLIERRLRAIDAYNQPYYRKKCVDLCSLLAVARKKQNSKMDSLKRGLARAVKVIF